MVPAFLSPCDTGHNGGILPLEICNDNQDDCLPLMSVSSMHPPRFLQSHMLSDWPECFLEIRCRWCEQRSMTIAVKGLMRWYGNKTFAEILSRLRCKFCRRRPSAVFLSTMRPGDPAATQRGQWTIVLVREGESRLPRNRAARPPSESKARTDWTAARPMSPSPCGISGHRR